MRLERLLEKQPVDSVTVLMLFVKRGVTCRLAQNGVISYRWRYLIIPLAGVEICICQFDIVTHFRCMKTSYLRTSTSGFDSEWPLDARDIYYCYKVSNSGVQGSSPNLRSTGYYFKVAVCML